MEFRVDGFEGPLDLLLHLIKENKMDIFDIEINLITEQYLKYINNLEKVNLEISEYLVLASELIEIKAKMLLPKKKQEMEIEEEDPREELVNKLLEYQAYKEISKDLKEKEELRSEIYTKAPEKYSNYQEEETTFEGGSVDLLIDAFKKFLIRKEEEKPLNTKVTKKGISVSSRRYEIKNLLKEKGKVSFYQMFSIRSREYIVVTFLAILEMAKNKELIIHQEGIYDEIICEGV
ncbi:MAG: segregation/condensation protein A [Bacilli bacterium]|jgi:scpA/B protein|nr:segregation/condensation protein A [Bacilli bacterium]